MNSREKGKRGERQWRDQLREAGFSAWRGQQHCGSPDSPDVVCPDLPGFHFEVKVGQAHSVYTAMAQAQGDCGARTPIVAHRRDHGQWLVTMKAEAFFALVRESSQVAPKPNSPNSL